MSKLNIDQKTIMGLFSDSRADFSSPTISVPMLGDIRSAKRSGRIFLRLPFRTMISPNSIRMTNIFSGP